MAQILPNPSDWTQDYSCTQSIPKNFAVTVFGQDGRRRGRALKRGMKFAKEGYLERTLEVRSDNDGTIRARGKCYASQRKKHRHSASLVLQNLQTSSSQRK